MRVCECVYVEMYDFWTQRFLFCCSLHVGKYYALLLLPRFLFTLKRATHTLTVTLYAFICTGTLTHFPQHIDESTAVYLWFEMEPIEAIWWIITCAFDELCNIRHKRSHAEWSSTNARSMKTLEHISLVFFIFSTSVFFASTSSSSSSMCNKCTVEKWNALVQARYFQTIEIEWQISAAAAAAAWGYKTTTTTSNSSIIHHFVKFNSLFLILTYTYSHAFLLWKNHSYRFAFFPL